MIIAGIAAGPPTTAGPQKAFPPYGRPCTHVCGVNSMLRVNYANDSLAPAYVCAMTSNLWTHASNLHTLTMDTQALHPSRRCLAGDVAHVEDALHSVVYTTPDIHHKYTTTYATWILLITVWWVGLSPTKMFFGRPKLDQHYWKSTLKKHFFSSINVTMFFIKPFCVMFYLTV